MAKYLILLFACFLIGSCAPGSEDPKISIEEHLKRAGVFHDAESWKELEVSLALLKRDYPQWKDSVQVKKFDKAIDSVANAHPIDKFRDKIHDKIGPSELIGSWHVTNVIAKDFDYRLDIYKPDKSDPTRDRMVVICFKNTDKFSDIIFYESYYDGGEFIRVRDSDTKDYYWIRDDGTLVLADQDGVIDSNFGYIVKTIKWHSIR